jgi:hypothetical protein
VQHDLFILGCGRSGTSAVAGLFRSAGYFQGTELHQPRPSNLRGFFEDAEVNNLNEALLAPLVPQRLCAGGIEYLADAPAVGQHWLARIPIDAEISATPSQGEHIRRILRNKPFCLKDPRFCYTLHLWRVHAPEARVICVFRHPQVVAASIQREVSLMPYLHSLALSVRQTYELWRLMYAHVLQRHAAMGDWLFVEYGDLFERAALDRIADFAGASIDRAFPAPELDRSAPLDAIDPAAVELYEQLLKRSKATLWR